MNDLSMVSDAIRAAVTEAQRLGASVEQVARWSKAVVVHMTSPISDEMRQSLKEQFPSLRYFQTSGDPHNPSDEGFFDDLTGTAISFPGGRKQDN